MKKCVRSIFALAIFASCLQGAVTLSSTSAIVASSVGSGSFSLTLNPAVAWSATSSAAWLTVSPTGGSANAVITYSWSANTLAVARMATISVAGASFSVLQLGSTGAYTAWNSSGYGKLTTIAGGGSNFSGDGGPATAVAIATGGAVLDANGNVYFTDSVYTNTSEAGRIRRVDAVTGVITTVAGTTSSGFSGDSGLAVNAKLNQPYGIVLDAAGDIYFSDNGNQRVRRIDAVTGIITTVAGNGTAGFSGDGGLAVNCELWDPLGLAIDAAGDIFIADRENDRIREVYAATGKIATVAGNGTFAFSGDGGAATAAALSGPQGVYVDSAGNLFIADVNNNRVRRVDAVTGNIATFAGGGSSGLTGIAPTQANFYSPEAVTEDASGNFFIATQNGVEEVVASTGLIATVVSNGSVLSIAADSFGNILLGGYAAVQLADFVTPRITLGSTAALASSAAGSGSVAVTVGPVGVLWYANGGTSWFTLTSASGAGSGTISYSYTANNTPQPRSAVVQVYGQTFLFTQAGFSVSLAPSSVIVSPSAGSGSVSLTVPAGVSWNAATSASWLGVSPGSGTGSATLTYTYTANNSSAGRLAVISVLGQSVAVSQVGAAGAFTPWGTSLRGIITTIAGKGTSGGTGDGGAATAATMAPHGVVADSNGNLFIADLGYSYPARIRRVDATTGLISTYAGGGTTQYSSGATATSVVLSQTLALALDSSGNLFFTGICGIYRVDVTGIMTTVAGTGTCGFGGDGGPATNALLNQPTSIALDSAGNLYIADNSNVRIRRVDAASGVITTIAGDGVVATTETSGVSATSSPIGPVNGIAVDAIGNVYIGDAYIRKIDVSTGLISNIATLSGQPAQTLALDSQGNLYEADLSRVWRVDTVAGTRTVIVGQASTGFGGDGGPALNASLYQPYGLFLDPAGNLFIADLSNFRVRFVDFTSPQITLSVPIAPLPLTAGSGTVGITVNPAGGFWFASSNANWLTLAASSGNGSGSLGYNYTANNSLAPRTGIITVSGQTLIVTQAGAAAALSQSFVTVGATGSSGTVGLTVTPSTAWTAQSSAEWLTVSPGSGSAGTTLTYTFGSNSSANARIATITVADQTLTMLQAGVSGSSSGWGTGSFYGQIRTIAGNLAVTNSSGDYGPALLAGVDPQSIAIDGSGNIYFADNYRVRRLDATTGIVTPVAGNGVQGYGGDGGSALAAKFSYPLGVALDAAGNVFISDGQNQLVRRVDTITGIITTVAGTGVAGTQGNNGPATAAQLNNPAAVLVDAFGNLFIAEQGRIQRVDATSGVITTVAGTGISGFGGDGGPATQAQLLNPSALAMDAAGDLYIADRNNLRIRRVDAVTGVITTVAGNFGGGVRGDGGPATQASLYYPQGVTLDRAGNLYIADLGNTRIRRVDSVTGIISTIAGTGTYAPPPGGDGGPAVYASFSSLACIAMDGAGNLYVCDNNLIRFIDLATPRVALAATSASAVVSGGSSSVAVTAGTGVAWSAVSDAAWLTVNSGTGTGNGNIAYTAAANTTPFSRTGVITILGQTFSVTQSGAPVALSALSAMIGPGAGSGTFAVTTGALGWTAQSSAAWLTITSTASSGSGTVTYTYTANTGTNARTAFVIAAGRSFGIVQMGVQGNYVQWGASFFDEIRTIAGTGTSTGSSASGIPATSAQVYPNGIAADGAGNVWFADFSTNRVRRVDAVTGLISTVAGNGTAGFAGDGGAATSAELNQPNWVAVDYAGNVFIADTSNNRIRRVDVASGIITTFAGGGPGGDGNLAAAAALSGPRSVFVDAGGNVYIADTGNNRVRVVDAGTGVISGVAGTGAVGQAGDGGLATQAQLLSATVVTADQAGNILVGGNYGIRRVDVATGLISSITSTYWNSLTAMTFDNRGDLFVLAGDVFRVDAGSGATTIVAGGGSGYSPAGDGGPATSAAFPGASAVAFDGGGNLYIGGEFNIRFVDLSSPVVSLGASTANVASGAGTSGVSITVTPSGDLWTATSSAAWLTLATPSGTGSGLIGYSFSANTSPDQRTGVISVMGQTLTVIQAGVPGTPPVIAFSPGSAIVSPSAGSGTFSLTISPAAAWTASSSAAWLTVSSASGSTNATVAYSFTANIGVNGRTATITAGAAQFQVVQLGTGGAYNPWGGFGFGIIRTIAGNGTQSFSGDGGPALAAGMSLFSTNTAYSYSATGLATDGNGNLYFVEPYDERVRRVDAVTGVITTAAGSGTAGYGGDFGPATSASLNGPNDVKVDSAGDLFIADMRNNVIRRVDAVTGAIATVAGTGVAGFSGDRGPAISATLNSPQNLTLDAAGNIFVADTGNNRIRRIDAISGTITTVAGTGVQSLGGDGGAATAAILARPEALALDSAGNLFVADNLNYRVRRIDAVTGIITTVAGNGNQNTATNGSVAATSPLNAPTGVAVDKSGNLYIDTYYGVQEVDAISGTIRTVTGGQGSPLGDGGPAMNASFTNPGALTLDSAGDLYIIDTGHALIRMVDFSSPQATFSPSAAAVAAAAGTGTLAITVSPAGSLWGASSSAPWLTLTTGGGAGSGTIGYSYSANTSTMLRTATISAYGQVFTLSQKGNVFVPSSAAISPASAIVVPAAGTGTFTLTSPAGVAWTAASTASWLSVSPGGGTGNATVSYSFIANPQSNARTATIVVAGLTFAVEQVGTSGAYTPWGTGGYGVIRTIVGGGTVSPPITGTSVLAASFGVYFLRDVTTDLNGNLVIVSSLPAVYRVDAAAGTFSVVTGGGCCNTGDGGPSVLASDVSPYTATADSAGNLFIADGYSGRIRRVDALTQIITTVAGGGSSIPGDGGPATAAGLNPLAEIQDIADDVYIADSSNNRVRYVNAATGVISTFAGNGTAGFSGDGGPATAAMVSNPRGLALSKSGVLYFADSGNNRIRRVDLSGRISTVAGNGINGFTGDGGPATSAELNGAGSIAVDAAGNLFIADNARVRRVDAVSGIITTVAGGGSGGDGSLATAARISSLQSVWVDGLGNLYIADGSKVRIVDFSSPQVTLGASTASVGNGAGSGSVSITVAPAGALWTASSSASWLTLTTATGAGSGAIAYSFTANSTVYPRTGTIQAYGQTLEVTQAGTTVSLTPASAIGAAPAGNGTIALTVQPGIAWTATSDAAWFTVSPASGTGSATLTYTFTANTATVSRAAIISVLSKVFEFVQPGSLGTYTPQYAPWGTTFAGQVIAIAGNGKSGYSGDGGPAISASFYGPSSYGPGPGIALDGSGNLFVADAGNNVIRRVDAGARTISTIAGNGVGGFSGDAGPALNNRLSQPGGVAVDSAGNVFIADTGNLRIRRVDAISGMISTIAGTGVAGTSGDGGPAAAATLTAPTGIAIDSSANIYFSDTGRIRRIAAGTGIISTVAGGGSSIAEGIAATSASFASITAFCRDGQANLFILDGSADRVRRVDSGSGLITTIAGLSAGGTATGNGGPAVLASLGAPTGLACDSPGNLYIYDSGIRRIDAASGIIAAFPGNSAATGISSPGALATDANGNLYISNNGGLTILFADTTTPAVALASPTASVPWSAGTAAANITVATPGAPWYATSSSPWLTVTTSDGTGSGSVGFSVAVNNSIVARTAAITVSGQTLLVTQTGIPVSIAPQSNTVVSPGSSATFALTIPSTAAWTATSSAPWLTVSPQSGTGSATLTYMWTTNSSASARMASIIVMGKRFAILQSGNTSNYTPWGGSVRGQIMTVAGGGSNVISPGTGRFGSVGYTQTSTTDGNGNFYVTTQQYIYQIQAGTGTVSPFAGNGTSSSYSGDSGPATQAAISANQLTSDAMGNIYFSDTTGRVRRVDAVTNIITTVAGNGTAVYGGDGVLATATGFSYPAALAVDPLGDVYFADSGGVRRVDALTGLVSTVASFTPYGLASDATGNIYAINGGVVRLDFSTGTTPLLAGAMVTAAPPGTGDGGPATAATLNYARSMAFDGNGNLFITDAGLNTVRRVDATTGLISTVAGQASYNGSFSGDGGQAVSAGLNYPTGLSIDPAGNLYFADANNVRIRFVDLSSPGTAAQSQTITFPALSNAIFGSSPVIPSGATSSSGLPVMLTTNSPAVCAVVSLQIVVVGPGFCSVTASQPGNGVYGAAAPVMRSFVVLAIQSITFGTLTNIAVGALPVTLSATASSGLTVSFTSTTPTVCSVSGNKATILTAGGCSITATQGGNGAWAPAAAVQNFTVLFNDVAPGDNDYAAINAMAQHGITAGCGSNGFCPDANVTRDEMAIFIVRAIYGNDNFTYPATPYFTDVTPSTFGFKWIQKLKDLGITNGCTATTYCPGSVVARDQMAVFIIRARLGLGIAGPSPTFSYPSTPYFTDAAAGSEFAFPWIQRMKLDGITNGCTATSYCPTNAVTRGQMAIFIMRGAFNQFLPAGTPLITQISPAILRMGTSGTYTITGTNTNFAQGTTQLSPIPGVTIGTITVNSPTSMTVQLSAASNAVAQPYSILANTGTEQDVLPNGLVLQ